MNKKVTVIVTTYNSSNCIQNTLDSILNQDGLNKEFDLELIVVDDCSTDDTIAILKQNNISYLSTADNSGGPNKGRNIALKASSGDYICIADHDDKWEKNRIISQLPFLEQVPIVSSGYTLIDEAKDKIIRRVNQSKREDENNIYYSKNQTFISKLSKSLKGQNTYIGSLIYRKELKEILFEESYGVVDFDWVLRLFYKRDAIEICDSLYNRYVDGFNLSLDEEYRKKDYDYSLLSIRSYEKEFPKEVRTSRKRINGSRARYYYLMDNMNEARKYFLKSEFRLKTLLYFLTTYVGAKYVKRKFNVFG